MVFLQGTREKEQLVFESNRASMYHACNYSGSHDETQDAALSEVLRNAVVALVRDIAEHGGLQPWLRGEMWYTTLVDTPHQRPPRW